MNAEQYEAILRKAQRQRENENWPKYTKLKNRIMSLVYEIQEGKCFYCKVTMTLEDGPNRVTREHRVPKSKGSFWTDDPVLSCYLCNWTKKNMEEAQFLLSLSFVEIIYRRIQEGVYDKDS